MKRFEAGLVRLEGWFVVLILLGMTGLSFVEVVLRGIFHTGLPWSNVVLRQAVLWVAMIGASLAASQKRHIKLDVLVRFLPKGGVRAAGVVVSLVSALLCGLLAHAGWVFVVSEWEFETVVYGGIPAWPFQTILPAGFALLALKFLFRLAEAVGRRKPEAEHELWEPGR